MSDEALCSTCKRPLNEGEAKTFTVCDECWDSIYAGSHANGERIREEARLAMFRRERDEARSRCDTLEAQLAAARGALEGCKRLPVTVYRWRGVREKDLHAHVDRALTALATTPAAPTAAPDDDHEHCEGCKALLCLSGDTCPCDGSKAPRSDSDGVWLCPRCYADAFGAANGRHACGDGLCGLSDCPSCGPRQFPDAAPAPGPLPTTGMAGAGAPRCWCGRDCHAAAAQVASSDASAAPPPRWSDGCTCPAHGPRHGMCRVHDRPASSSSDAPKSAMGALRDRGRWHEFVHAFAQKHWPYSHPDDYDPTDEQLIDMCMAALEADRASRGIPGLDPLGVACPLPSCGATAGEACNRDTHGMGVHRVEHPMVHAVRCIRALAVAPLGETKGGE